jgi:hypothetical protein
MTISLEEHVAKAIRPLRATYRRARGANNYEYFVLDPDDESLPAGQFSAGPFPTFDEARHEAKLMNARAAIAAVSEHGAPDPSEAMRAKCEAKARKRGNLARERINDDAVTACFDIADAIAALKGNGGGN